MDLKSSAPIWPILNGLPATFPSLQESLQTDVAIIGAGVTGALIADALSREGLNVVVLDRREAVHGSTSASTCLLQYEIDTSLTELSKIHGEEAAARAYRLCGDSIDQIAELVGGLGDDCGFQRKKSCYFASRERDARALKDEGELRRKHGFDVTFLDAGEFADRFEFEAAGALWSTQAAEVDGYRLAYRLLERARQQGARIFDRTDCREFEATETGWNVHCDREVTVKTHWLVFATGYEAVNLLPRKIVRLHSSFAIASQPLKETPGWPDRCLLWETARPYCYVRTLEDGRAVMGGEDEKFRSPTARDALIPRKTARLEERVKELFPRLEWETEYAWAGTFGETDDGLPYIGRHEGFPQAAFALGYGGNGITYSMIAARLLTDLIRGRENRDLELFRFDRS